jgi:hypothetical protein
MSAGNGHARLPEKRINLPPDRLVIGVGSGLMGFETAELCSNGHITVVMSLSEEEPLYAEASSDASISEVRALLNSRNALASQRLMKVYSNDVSDGTQAFLYMKSGSDHHYTWCSNVFPKPLQQVWEDIRALVSEMPLAAWRIRYGIDGQTANRQVYQAYLKFGKDRDP